MRNSRVLPQESAMERSLSLIPTSRTLTHGSGCTTPILGPGTQRKSTILCCVVWRIPHFQLTFKYPQYASATCGRVGTLLHSASQAGHLQVVRVLPRARWVSVFETKRTGRRWHLHQLRGTAT